MSKTKVVAVAVGIPLALVVLTVGAFAVRWVTADIRGQADAREQTLGDGDFRLAAYDHFFDLCASVQSHEGRLASLQEELDGDPSASRVEQVEASMTAVRSQRREAINSYNADAAKDYTAGQFRDADLPYELSINAEETRCVA